MSVLLTTFLLQSVFSGLQQSPLLPLAAAALPISIGIAVLRYRLYDIDLIINKALSTGRWRPSSRGSTSLSRSTSAR